jgi:hypothetical protein
MRSFLGLQTSYSVPPVSCAAGDIPLRGKISRILPACPLRASRAVENFTPVHLDVSRVQNPPCNAEPWVLTFLLTQHIFYVTRCHNSMELDIQSSRGSFVTASRDWRMAGDFGFSASSLN